jgi:PAS domain S-box-containing protein
VENHDLVVTADGVPPSVVASAQAREDQRDLAVVALERTRMPMAITDPRQDDNPIVLANQAFLELCGYSADEVIGRNCRFLQGPGTDRGGVDRLRQAIKNECEIEVELLNYRKDGSSFWNKIFVSPVHDTAGELLYFFASQKDETARMRATHLEKVERVLLQEVDHRTKNALALVQSIVFLSQRKNVQSFASSIEGRIGSIVRSHVLLSDYNWGDVPIARLFELEASEESKDLIMLEGPVTSVPAELVQPLALIIHEIFDNAVKHGALSAQSGKVEVVWKRHDDHGIGITIQESGGPAPQPVRQSGLGLRLIDRIVRQQLGGTAEFTYDPPGAMYKLTISQPH